MKKIKQLLAWIGILLLVALYASTIVFAVIGSERSILMLRVSIYCTIIVPILLWAYSFIYKLIKGSVDEHHQKPEAMLSETAEEANDLAGHGVKASDEDSTTPSKENP